jgi:SPP1 family predicted phage head-tail adaptor
MIWPKLNPGDLRHRVTVVEETVTANAAGTDTVLSPVISAWAKIEPMRGADIIRSGQNITELPVIVSMYYDARVQPKMLLQTLNGRYAIQAIRNVLELNAVMELTCITIAGAE